MKKVIRLVGVQLWAVLGSMLAIGESKKKKTKALYIGFIIFVIVMSGASFTYAYAIGMGLKQFNSIDLLPSLFMALTSIIVLFTTIYKVKGTLFGFKDYDMVMSLPVSSSQIILSRIILLYSVNFVFLLIVMLPMMLAYGILAVPGIHFYVYSILMLLFIPLIPIIIASILGSMLTYLSMRFKYSNVIYMIFLFLMLMAFIIAPFFIGDSEQALVEISHSINKQINSIYPLSEIYSKAVINGDIVMMLLFIAVSVFAFIAFSLVVGRVFKRINTFVMTGTNKANYKLGRLKSYSPLRAIYIKDLKRYFASSIYVMNTGFGVVMLVLGSIALPFIDINSISGGVNIEATIRDIIPVFITFCIATSSTTMASISIEGKHIWIIKNLPVSVSMIFISKILVNLTILAPTLLASVIIAFTLRLAFIKGLLLILSVASFSIFISMYGLVINLSFPNLSWSNETVIVKQSNASMISVFSGIGITVIQYILIMVTGSPIRAMLIFIILLWILNLLLYRRLTNGAIRQFERL